MHTVLEVLADRSLFFLDSRTSADSVGYRAALALGVPAAERQVFLDSDLTGGHPGAVPPPARLARMRGAAIAIGHPHPVTIDMLAAEVPRPEAPGVPLRAGELSAGPRQRAGVEAAGQHRTPPRAGKDGLYP